MANAFGSEGMAAGYANSRPAVHPRVMERVWRGLERTAPFALALDVGCGAGVSTRALDGFAERSIGLDPAAPMLRWAARVAPQAQFVAGAAEALPFGGGRFDLITAAGSLNYADLDRFFPEARRVLSPGGVLVVYDFSPGRNFPGEGGLDEWFGEFYRRYPPPADEGSVLDPAILAGRADGFREVSSERFEISLLLSPDFYLGYVLTETNVADAVRRGVPLTEIRTWCADTLEPLWNGAAHEVVFRGYFSCLGAG